MAWRVLLFLVTSAVFRIVNASSTCAPEHFGTGIDVKDCIALEDEIYKSLEPDQDYTVTRTFSLHNPDRRQRVPQVRALRTCGIGFDIADPEQQTITTTVLNLRLNIQALMNDCVSQGGHGGFRIAEGLVFVLSNPLVVNGYGTCLAAQIPFQPTSSQRLNLLQCMNKHGSGPAFYQGMKAMPDHDPRPVQPDYGAQGRSETQHTRRAALPILRTDSPAPEVRGRPPRPPIGLGRGRGRHRGQSPGPRGQSPSPGGQSPRARLDQASPQTYYAGSRTPSGSAYREQSPAGTEGSVFGGHAGPDASRENSPGLDYGQYPPLAPAHGSASIPNIPHGGYLPGFHPQYEHFQAHNPTVPMLSLPLYGSPGVPSQVHRSPGPIAQGLQGIPGVDLAPHPAGPIAQGLQGIPGVDSAPHPAGPIAQESQDTLRTPSPGPSHGSTEGEAQAAHGGAAPPPAQGELPIGSSWRPSYSGAVQQGVQNGAPQSPGPAITPPGLRGIQGDLPRGALWVPHRGNNGGNDT